jgi:very-short-patch-repair endonuclease
MGKVSQHNREMIAQAEYRAGEMTVFPSRLEEMMMEFLDSNGIGYESQKIFYIYDDDGWIRRYFIADFFIPDRNIIIEVDGKFHDRHRQKDRDRTRIIQESYPDVQVLRYTWNDLSDDDMMRDLLWLIR